MYLSRRRWCSDMDRLSKEKRSWNMSRIPGKDTKPERIVRSILHRMGYRFRLHRKDLPGTPDIVLPKYGTVIFVHGCYWHRHPGCKFAYTPKSRVQFWNKKFQNNVRNDTKAKQQLEKMGWCVITVWECEIRKLPQLVRRLKSEIADLSC